MATRIREFRVRAMLTQQQLAVKLGVSVSTVARWEEGQTEPSALAIEALRRMGFQE